MKDKILKQFESGYSSSPRQIEDNEVQILIDNGCVCDNCNKSIFELDDFPDFKDGSVYCEECYDNEFREICPICEDSFESPTKPDEHRLCITKELTDYLNDEKEESEHIKAGLYKVIKYPFHHGNILSGFEGFFNRNISLQRECNMNSMLSKIDGRHHEEVTSGEICHDCFNKFIGITPLPRRFKHTGEEIDRTEEASIIKNGE